MRLQQDDKNPSASQTENPEVLLDTNVAHVIGARSSLGHPRGPDLPLFLAMDWRKRQLHVLR